MTFREKYDSSESWHEKVQIMEILHLSAIQSLKGWNTYKTATFFGVSAGLVSENLQLAKAIHSNEKILKCETRKDALKELNKQKWSDLKERVDDTI